MTTDKARWSIDSEGCWVSFRVERNAAQALTGKVLGGKRYVLEIREERGRRSRDANAYFWVLAGKLAAHYGISPEEVYRQQIKGIGGVYDVVCVSQDAVERLTDRWARKGMGWMAETVPSKIEGCVNVILWYGSSTYDTRQMSQLIDRAVQDCKDVGIETMTPEGLSRLEGYGA